MRQDTGTRPWRSPEDSRTITIPDDEGGEEADAAVLFSGSVAREDEVEAEEPESSITSTCWPLLTLSSPGFSEVNSCITHVVSQPWKIQRENNSMNIFRSWHFLKPFPLREWECRWEGKRRDMNAETWGGGEKEKREMASPPGP